MNEVDILKLVASLTALVVAIVGHEIMHGWVAYRYGDMTAKRAGRLRINPFVHIDPVGSLLVPGVLYFSGAPFIFGWAKPVPVDIRTVMRNGGAKGAVSVALAGIVFNLLSAALAASVLPFFIRAEGLLATFAALFLFQFFIISLVLAVFNLWPIPPLDGAQALRYLAEGLKWHRFTAFYDRIYPYGMLLLFAVLFTPLSTLLFAPVNWLAHILL